MILVNSIGFCRIQVGLGRIRSDSSRTWSDSVRFGRIQSDSVGLGRIQLAGLGSTWSDLLGSGRILSDYDFGKFGRIYVGFSRIWYYSFGTCSDLVKLARIRFLMKKLQVVCCVSYKKSAQVV